MISRYKSYIWPLPSFLFCIWGITDVINDFLKIMHNKF